MKAETEGMLKNYQLRFDELNERANAIMERGNAIGATSPDAANASRMFAMAKGKLDQLRAEVTNGPAEAAKAKTKLDLQKYFDRTEKSFETGFVEINTDFDAVESWITIAEQRSSQVATRREPVVPPPPGNPGEHGAGGTAPAPTE